MATTSSILEHFDNSDELAHYGIKGMKWGVRRSQEELDRLAGRTSSARKKTKKQVLNAYKRGADMERSSSAQSRKTAREYKKDVYKRSKNLYRDRKVVKDALKRDDRYEKRFDKKPGILETRKQERKNRKHIRKTADHHVYSIVKEEHKDVTLREIRRSNRKDKEFQKSIKETSKYVTKSRQETASNEKAANWNFSEAFETEALDMKLGDLMKAESARLKAERKEERRRKKVKHDQITPDDVYLSHYGIKGMKWGVRRSQEELDRLAGRVKKTSNRIKTNRQNRNRVKAQKAAGKHQKKLKKQLNKVERLENKAETSRLKANRKISKHLHKTLGQVKPLTDSGRVYNHSETMRENLRNRPKGNLPKNRSERQLVRQQRINDLANIKQYKKHLRSEAKANKVSGKIGITRNATGYGDNSNKQKAFVKEKKGVAGKATDFVVNTTKKAAKDAVKGTIERNVKTVYNEIAGNHINKKVDDILEPYKRSQKKKKKKRG